MLREIVLPERGSLARTDTPGDVQRFLKIAHRRIDQYCVHSCTPGFVPSDYQQVYRVLEIIAANNMAVGTAFCEWGSGFGVVACLASMLGFEACGIEIEPALVDGARQLAEDHGFPIEFHCGSFIPEGGETLLDEERDGSGDGFGWLARGQGTTPEELELPAEDFDVIFAYPWPGEEHIVAALFRRYAAEGALLITYHGSEDIRVRRKVQGRRA